MGCFGCGPNDSDDAQDFLCKLLKSKDLQHLVDVTLQEEYRDDSIRVIANILVLISGYIKHPFLFNSDVYRAIEKLELLLNDKEWIGEWKNRRKIKAEIKKQIEALKKCL